MAPLACGAFCLPSSPSERLWAPNWTLWPKLASSPSSPIISERQGGQTGDMGEPFTLHPGGQLGRTNSPESRPDGRPFRSFSLSLQQNSRQFATAEGRNPPIGPESGRPLMISAQCVHVCVSVSVFGQTCARVCATDSVWQPDTRRTSSSSKQLGAPKPKA